MAGAPHGKLRRCEKLSVLRKLLRLLIHFHIVAVRDAAREIEYDLFTSSLDEATLDHSLKSLGSQCTEALPGAKGEILPLLDAELRKKPARHHPKSLSWVQAAFPDSQQHFYYPGISEIARIRTFTKCTELPSEAQFVVVLGSTKVNLLAGKKRNWFQTHEVDPLFTKFETGKLKTHLVIVEKKERCYDLLVIVCPPCVQPVALTCAEEEWRGMFTKMVEKLFGSKSHRDVDKGFRINEIFMSGFRWTRNFDYCYRDICAGPFTPSRAAAADNIGHADFETSMEKFAIRMGYLLHALNPAFVAGNKQHTADIHCSMPGSGGIAVQVCATSNYWNCIHQDTKDTPGTVSVGKWQLCGVDSKPRANAPLTRFLLTDWGISLLLCEGVVLVWAATKFKHCTVPLSPPVEGASPWVLGSAMYIKDQVIKAKDGQDRRRNARPPMKWLTKRQKTRIGAFIKA